MAEASTKAILVRDVPEELLRIMKASAAMSGLSLQAWCLEVLKARVQGQAHSAATLILAPAPQEASAQPV